MDDRSLVTFDELDTSPKHLGTQFSAELDTMISEGWILFGQRVPSLAPPVPWNEYEGSFSFHLHAWEPLTFLLKGSCVVEDTSKAAHYFDVSFAFARDWLENFQVPAFLEGPAGVLARASSQKAGFAWYDMGVGQRIYRLAFILDVISRDAAYSDQDVALFYRSLRFHHAILKTDEFFGAHSNHGLYQALGQLAAAKRFREVDEESRICFELATDRLWQCLDRHFSEDNVHKEHSAGYHYMILGSLIGALQTELIEDPRILDRIAGMEEALTWMVQPDNGLISSGDSDPRTMYRGSLLGERFTRPELQFIISGEKIGKPPRYGVRSYADAGYAFARLAPEDTEQGTSDIAYLAQMAGFHSRVHKHADHLSFIWYDKQREILVDPGRYGYVGRTPRGSELFEQGFWYSDPKRIYVESTRSHNCVEIDAQSYARKGVKPFGSALKSAREQNGLAVTECEATHFRTVRHWRGLVMAPGRFLLVLDWLNDRPSAREYRQWFKFHSNWHVSRDGEHLRAFSPAREQREALSLTAASLLDEPCWGTVFEGQEKPTLAGWMSDAAYSLIPAPSVAVELEKRQMASFATLFSFGEVLQVDRIRTRTNASLKNGKFFWKDERGPVALHFRRGADEKFSVTLNS